MKVTQMPPVHAANLMTNNGNTADGVDIIQCMGVVSQSLYSHRLLHSSSLVVVGLSMGYETWPPIGWHHPFVVG